MARRGHLKESKHIKMVTAKNGQKKYTPEQLEAMNAKMKALLEKSDFEGFTEASDDVVGFWTEDEGPIYGIPRGVRIFDSSIDARKMSALITFELLGSCAVVAKDDEGKETLSEAEAGQLVGVWAKPGMRALKRLQDVPVLMGVSGEKEIGKPNPMVKYSVKREKNGNLLTITSDTRKESKKEDNWITQGMPAKVIRKAGNQLPPAGDASDEDYGLA